MYSANRSRDLISIITRHPIERVPVATASETVHVVSICQWHISVSIFRVNKFGKRKNIIKNLVRSFFLVVGSPRRSTTATTTTISDMALLSALREEIFEAGQQEETYVQRSLHPSQEGRGGRHLGRRCGGLNVVVIYCGMFPLKIPFPTTYKT